MLRKQTVLTTLMLLVLTALAGCSEPGTAQGQTPTKPPTPSPVISEPATPTPIDQQTATMTPVPTEALADATASPSPTATPTPSATPTPTATPTPSPTPTPIPTVPPAPVAVNTDTSTYTFLVNRDYPLTNAYAPKNLVAPDIPFSFDSKTADKRKLLPVAAEALEELCAAAQSEEGLTINGVSGYRSYDRQYEIYGGKLVDYYLGKRTLLNANKYSAYPGASEHQTGLAIDVSCDAVGNGLIERFAQTEEGIWLSENAWRFGFILRYPKDKEDITGYAYEPWHIRYVGVPLAYYLYTNDLTLDEYYGSPSSYTQEKLAETPFIDTTTNRFYKLYASVNGTEAYFNEDGSYMVSSLTNLPVLKKKILDMEGNAILLDNKPIYIEPVLAADGSIAVDAYTGEIYHTKPYFDMEGNLWLDYNSNPVFLQPLWNADGSLAMDMDGNLLYTEPLLYPNGVEYIAEDGSLLLKVPIRAGGELVWNPDGTIAFYEPFINPITNEFIYDSATGLPLFPSEYYEVPHNTLPIPTEEDSSVILPEMEFDEPLEENPFYSQPEEETPEDSFYDFTNETGGFPE